MTWVLLIVVVIVVGCIAHAYGKPAAPLPPVDPGEEVKAQAELHEIRRKLDVGLVKHEQRRDAERIRREIAEALGDDES